MTHIPDRAVKKLHEQFLNSPYIGSAQIWDKKETGLGKHKFFYIGYYDIFGVRLPEMGPKGRADFQIWPLSWVKKRIRSLDTVVAKAMTGEFARTRHNIQLQERAKKHGRKFFRKPKRLRPLAKTSLKEDEKLPIRKRKRKRRQLKL